MTPTLGTRAIGYARVSTAEQAVSGLGLAAQRTAIEAACASRGWNLIDLVEETQSGAGDLDKRPLLTEVRGRLKAGEADTLVVAKFDRLSRSVQHFARFLEEAQKYGWGLVALDADVDTSTAAGEFVANTLANAAQYERRLISQRTKDALATARAQGVRLGRPPVVAAEIRERIRTERAEGRTLRAIAAGLMFDNVPTAHGGHEWHASTVSAILQAPS